MLLSLKNLSRSATASSSFALSPNDRFLPIFFASDLGTIVSIDVTPLMREAQRLGLTDFQVRFVLDFVTNVGFVGIEDLPSVFATAPLLTVNYVL